MPISVTCGECDKQLKVKEEAAGKKVRCPGCGGIVKVPKLEEPELDDLEDFEEDEEDFRPRKSSSKRRKPADDEFDFGGDDELEDELPPPRRSSGKSAKVATKKKAKPRRSTSGGFLEEFYEGRLSEILAYCFWAIFGILWMGCCTGKHELLMTYLLTMYFIVWVRGMITVFWWAKICARDSSLGILIYVAFYFVPCLALLYAVTNNSACEKPNRLFMFSIGISAMAGVAFFLSAVVAVGVFNVKPG